MAIAIQPIQNKTTNSNQTISTVNQKIANISGNEQKKELIKNFVETKTKEGYNKIDENTYTKTRNEEDKDNQYTITETVKINKETGEINIETNTQTTKKLTDAQKKYSQQIQQIINAQNTIKKIESGKIKAPNPSKAIENLQRYIQTNAYKLGLTAEDYKPPRTITTTKYETNQIPTGSYLVTQADGSQIYRISGKTGKQDTYVNDYYYKPETLNISKTINTQQPYETINIISLKNKLGIYDNKTTTDKIQSVFNKDLNKENKIKDNKFQNNYVFEKEIDFNKLKEDLIKKNINKIRENNLTINYGYRANINDNNIYIPQRSEDNLKEEPYPLFHEYGHFIQRKDKPSFINNTEYLYNLSNFEKDKEFEKYWNETKDYYIKDINKLDYLNESQKKEYLDIIKSQEAIADSYGRFIKNPEKYIKENKRTGEMFLKYNNINLKDYYKPQKEIIIPKQSYYPTTTGIEVIQNAINTVPNRNEYNTNNTRNINNDYNTEINKIYKEKAELYRKYGKENLETEKQIGLGMTKGFYDKYLVPIGRGARKLYTGANVSEAKTIEDMYKANIELLKDKDVQATIQTGATIPLMEYSIPRYIIGGTMVYEGGKEIIYNPNPYEKGTGITTTALGTTTYKDVTTTIPKKINYWTSKEYPYRADKLWIDKTISKAYTPKYYEELVLPEFKPWQDVAKIAQRDGKVIGGSVSSLSQKAPTQEIWRNPQDTEILILEKPTYEENIIEANKYATKIVNELNQKYGKNRFTHDKATTQRNNAQITDTLTNKHTDIVAYDPKEARVITTEDGTKLLNIKDQTEFKWMGTSDPTTTYRHTGWINKEGQRISPRTWEEAKKIDVMKNDVISLRKDAIDLIEQIRIRNPNKNIKDFLKNDINNNYELIRIKDYNPNMNETPWFLRKKGMNEQEFNNKLLEMRKKTLNEGLGKTEMIEAQTYTNYITNSLEKYTKPYNYLEKSYLGKYPINPLKNYYPTKAEIIDYNNYPNTKEIGYNYKEIPYKQEIPKFKAPTYNDTYSYKSQETINMNIPRRKYKREEKRTESKILRNEDRLAKGYQGVITDEYGNIIKTDLYKTEDEALYEAQKYNGKSIEIQRKIANPNEIRNTRITNLNNKYKRTGSQTYSKIYKPKESKGNFNLTPYVFNRGNNYV